MIHLSRSILIVFVAMIVGLLAIMAGCWVTSRRGPPPPVVFVTRTPTRTAIPITVRPVTQTPALVSPTARAVTPTPSALAPAEQLTTTFTPNPSTLITPSPQTLPATGDASKPNLVVTLLAGGVALLWIGLLARWASKPKG